MCSMNDHPPYDIPADLVVMVRPTCDRIIWSRGEDRRCGQVVGLQTWKDEAGIEHAACQYHVKEMLHRHPEAPVPAGGYVSKADAERLWDR